MTIQAIREYVYHETGYAISPQTVRNWMKKGRGGVCLKEDPHKIDIQTFFKKVGTNFSRGRPAKTAV